MAKARKSALSLFLVLMALAVCFAFRAAPAHAGVYTLDAALKNSETHPGVYYVKADPADAANANATIGIPSLNKNALTAPTTESPAIIMGAAIPFEVKTGPTEFTKITDMEIYPPYSYFRYSIIEEQGADGTWHQKMSGFDGSYFIIRVDVSELIKDAPEGSFLHVSQEGNKALMPLLRYQQYNAAENPGKGSFSDALGNMTAVYAIAEGGGVLKDTAGSDTATPYVDVIIYSSGTLVAGADTGSTAPGAASADFKLKFYIDQTPDYNTGLDYDPNNQSTTTPTHAQQVLAKFYDETKASGAKVNAYTVKGNDLEIEIMNDESSPRQCWSLREAMGYYNNSPIKMICEVPVLEGLLIENHNVIFDVNSFDIQISNHQSGDAALTVRNGTLTVMDSFNTTGAELAVGNNARMSIEAGGKLIITDTCQLEVEYDAASTAPGTDPVTYDVGLITIADGGEIVNNGVISIEGTEGKPIDPANPVIRDMKAAALNIEPGGKLTNNGAVLAYGTLKNLGTIENNGHYVDTIESNDPDKGRFTYHKGIQIAWKDDVTQAGVLMGQFNNGDESHAQASVVNNGDIVLTPGFLENYGSLTNTNKGSIYLCAVDEAVIPTSVTWSVLVLEQRIGFERPLSIFLTNQPGSTLTNAGIITAAQVEITGNGRTGKLTPSAPANLPYEIGLNSFGQMTNSGSIALNKILNYAEMSNSGSIGGRIVLSNDVVSASASGSLIDSSEQLTNVFNGVKNGATWTYTECSELTVTPPTQYGVGGQTVNWTFHATPKESGDGARFLVLAYQGNSTTPLAFYEIEANSDVTLASPALPYELGNAVYDFYVSGGIDTKAYANINISSSPVIPPAPVSNLVYNGKDQNLISAGSTNDKNISMQYRLGENGEWKSEIPLAKNAGTYQVFYKLSSENEGGEFQSVEAVIGKRPVTISANDLVSQTDSELAQLTWTTSGLLSGEELSGVTVSLQTTADRTKAGTYPITVEVSGENQNYSIASTAPGTYTVSDNAFVVTAKDKYGVFSDETTYKGFNIDLTAPEGALIYYSTREALTKDNYKRAGIPTMVNLPATSGTHTVYYYVTDKDNINAVSGSKQVIIAKAEQAAPDASKLKAYAETYRQSGDGYIDGLTPYKMEYRSKGNNGSYSNVYNAQVYVIPGTYLIRMAADDNHFASPDTEITVEKGQPITVTFASNGGSEVASATDLSYGDQLTLPTAPTMPNANFLGWFWIGSEYDFTSPVIRNMTLTAGWTPITIDFKLPAEAREIGIAAFEGIPVKSVEIPAKCTSIQANAFKDCGSLKQLVLLSAQTVIDPDAFSGCTGIYIFAPLDSPARDLCTADNGFIFVENVK